MEAWLQLLEPGLHVRASGICVRAYATSRCSTSRSIVIFMFCFALAR